MYGIAIWWYLHSKCDSFNKNSLEFNTWPRSHAQIEIFSGTEIILLLGKPHHISAFVTKELSEKDISATIYFRDIKKLYYYVTREFKYQIFINN